MTLQEGVCIFWCAQSSPRSSETRKQVRNRWSALWQRQRLPPHHVPLFTPESSPGLRHEG